MNKIHVVIPVYNVEKYLEQAVRSVLDQPYKGFDIVLVDDGSPDSSGDICDRLAAEYDCIEVIHKENGGLSSARNAGIDFVLSKDSTKHDYIAFLDSDDVWKSDAITESLAHHIFGEWRDDIISFSHCRANNKLTRFSHAVSHKELCVKPAYDEIWRAQESLMCAKLYSVDLLNKWDIRFVPKQQYCEDVMFIYQTVYMAESIRYLSDCLYIYRGNPGGMMSNILKRDPIDHYGKLVDGWVKCDDFLNQYESLTNRRATAGYSLGNVYLLDMARYHYKRFGKKKRLEEALKNHPHYEGLFKISTKNASQAQVKDRDLLVNHPLLFRAKYNLIGVVEKIARSVKDSKLVAPLWEKKKYPLDHFEK